MPIHFHVELFELEEELTRLKEAGKKVTHILPVLIEHKPNNIFGKVITFAVVFEDAK